MCEGDGGMELSARDQLRGVMETMQLGGIMAEVVVDVGGQEVAAAITRSSVERLALQPGDHVTVVIKSTEVLIGT